jgi:hypothetical protein
MYTPYLVAMLVTVIFFMVHILADIEQVGSSPLNRGELGL